MIEVDLKYCPSCNDEYMPQIDMCAACGIRLVTGREMLEQEADRRRRLEARQREIGADEDLVNIRRGPLAEMKSLAAALDAELIGSLVTGDEKACGKGCCPTHFFLQVRRDDAAEALAVLDEHFRKATALQEHDTAHADAVFDPRAPEASCPACGFRFSTRISTCPDCGLCIG